METEYYHPQVFISKYNISVDKDLAVLIEKLWNKNIYTLMSCQENKPEICWIMFEDEQSAVRFLNVTHDLLIRYYWAMSLTEMKRQQVAFSICPHNLSEDFDEEQGIITTGKPNYMFNISIRFPNELIPEMEKLF